MHIKGVTREPSTICVSNHMVEKTLQLKFESKDRFFHLTVITRHLI